MTSKKTENVQSTNNDVSRRMQSNFSNISSLYIKLERLPACKLNSVNEDHNAFCPEIINFNTSDVGITKSVKQINCRGGQMRKKKLNKNKGCKTKSNNKTSANCSPEIQIKQEEIHIIDIQDSRANLDNVSPRSTKKKPTSCSDAQPNNKLSPLNGALHSILSDIVILRREYKSIEDSPLEDEIQKMRSKYNLPSLPSISPVISDHDECSSEGLEEDNRYLRNVSKTFYNENQNDNEDSDTLIIDESEFDATDQAKTTNQVDEDAVNNILLQRIPDYAVCPKISQGHHTFREHIESCKIKINEVFSLCPTNHRKVPVQCTEVQTKVNKKQRSTVLENVAKRLKTQSNIKAEIIEIDDD